MKKVYDIYVNGRLEAFNISMEEELATVDNFIKGLADIGASEDDKELLREIEDGASVEIIEQGEFDDIDEEER